MEKCRNESKTKSCRRLLIIIILIFISLTQVFSQTQNFEIDASEFYFQPGENQNFYENEDINFELQLENLNPSEIELESSDLPESVKLRLFRKMEKNGTLINVWLNFTHAGEFELNDFIFLLYPNGKSASNPQKLHVKFPKIIITKNLSIQKPEIHIIFDEKTTAILTKESSVEINKPEVIYQKKYDERLLFTIYAKYVHSISNFDYEIPKNVILKQTKKFDFANNVNQTENEQYSEKLIPIASFEMICLQTGKTAFPKFTMQFEDFQHQTEIITIDNYVIEIIQQNEELKEKGTTMFDAAFEDLELQKQTIIDSSSKNLSSNEKTDEECLKLAKKLKSSHQKKVLFLFSVITALFIFTFIIIAKKVQKKKFLLITDFVVFVIYIFIFVNSFAKNKNAVFLGGTVHSIPDEKASDKTYLNSGTPVKILKKTENWYLIKFQDESSLTEKSFQESETKIGKKVSENKKIIDSSTPRKTGWCKKNYIIY